MKIIRYFVLTSLIIFCSCVPPEIKFLTKLAKGNPEEIQEAISDGIKVDELHFIIVMNNNNIEIAELLLKNNPELNINLLLGVAVSNNKINFATFLWEKGAQLGKGKYIENCIEKNYLEMLNLLLEKKVPFQEDVTNGSIVSDISPQIYLSDNAFERSIPVQVIYSNKIAINTLTMNVEDSLYLQEYKANGGEVLYKYKVISDTVGNHLMKDAIDNDLPNLVEYLIEKGYDPTLNIIMTPFDANLVPLKSISFSNNKMNSKKFNKNGFTYSNFPPPPPAVKSIPIDYARKLGREKIVAILSR